MQKDSIDEQIQELFSSLPSERENTPKEESSLEDIYQRPRSGNSDQQRQEEKNTPVWRPLAVTKNIAIRGTLIFFGIFVSVVLFSSLCNGVSEIMPDKFKILVLGHVVMVPCITAIVDVVLIGLVFLFVKPEFEELAFVLVVLVFIVFLAEVMCAYHTRITPMLKHHWAIIGVVVFALSVVAATVMELVAHSRNNM